MQNKGALAAAFLAVWAFSAHAQVFNPESFKLKNGMEVVVLPNHRAPVVTHMLWLKAGAMEDPEMKSGIAHFQEHLMFKGTKKRKEGEYSKIISHLGGQENAFTSYDFTAYYATVGKEYLPLIMDLESDRLYNWRISQKQLDAEKLVILKERQQTVDNQPISRFWEKVDNRLFKGSPYERPVIGWQNEIEKLSLKDIQDFHAKYYAPYHMVLVISGDVTAAEVKPLVEKYYETENGLPANTEILPRGFVEMAETVRRFDETSLQVKEVLWSMHYIASRASPETILKSDSLSVLAKILGDGRIGRLYRRLVMQDKTATQASISFDPVARGPVRFSIVVTPAPGVDPAVIEKTVNEEIAAIVEKPLTAEEIKNATQAMDIETVYARDSVMGPAMIVGEALASGLDIATIEAWPMRLRKVTPESVHQAAVDLFNTQKPLIAILRPATPEKKK